MSTFENLLAGVLGKMNLKESAVPTKVFILNDVKILERENALKLTVKEIEALKKLVEIGNFKICEGEWGARCRMSYILGDRRFSGFCNIYDENYERDFEERELTDEDKKRLVIVFYEKPNDFSFRIFIMNDENTSIDEVIEKLNIV